MTSQPLQRLERIQGYFWPKGTGADVWAIVDGASDRQIHWSLTNSHLTHSCLYSGQLPPVLEEVAPYLVQLYSDDGVTRRLIEEGWGKSWGVFLKCGASMHNLRRHLRGFLTVHDESGRRLVFRYYDPRVLRAYLPTCTTDELRTVFGPIECFWTEGEDRRAMLQFAFNGRKLDVEELRLE
jgi:hypothetical protein